MILIVDFTMVPNKLFYNKDENEKSLFQKHKDYKLFLVMSYLHTNTNRRGKSFFELRHICEKCGVKYDGRKGKSKEQLIEILKFLQKENMLDCNIDIDSIKCGQVVECNYDCFEKDSEGNNIKFTVIEHRAIDKIMDYKDISIDKIKLVYYYSYLVCRMYKREQGKSIYSGGKPEVCYPSFVTINKDTKLTDKTIMKYNSILEEMNLIRIDNLGTYIDRNDKVKKESPNFYTLVPENEIDMEKEKTTWFANLKEAKKIFINQNPDYIFLGEKCKYVHDNRSLYGYISSLKKKFINGTLSTEEEDIYKSYLFGSVDLIENKNDCYKG